jgi:hypothetical protein
VSSLRLDTKCYCYGNTMSAPLPRPFG